MKIFTLLLSLIALHMQPAEAAAIGKCRGLFEASYWSHLQDRKEIREVSPLFAGLKRDSFLGLTDRQYDILKHAQYDVYMAEDRLQVDLIRDDIPKDLDNSHRIAHLGFWVRKAEDGSVFATAGHMAIGSNGDGAADHRERGLGLGRLLMQKAIDLLGRDATIKSELAGDNRDALLKYYTAISNKKSPMYRSDLDDKQRMRLSIQESPAYKLRKRLGMGTIVEPTTGTLFEVNLTVTNDHTKVTRVEGLEQGDLAKAFANVFGRQPSGSAEINSKGLIPEFTRLRDSPRDSERIKYCDTFSSARTFDSLGLYPISQFIRDLEAMLNDRNSAFDIRKAAYLALIANRTNQEFSRVKNAARAFSSAEQQAVVFEIASWRNSPDMKKRLWVQNLANDLRSADLDAVQFVMSLGDVIDINDTEGTGPGSARQTSLQAAVKGGREEIALALLSHPRININAGSKTSDAVLVTAAERGYVSIVKRLLQFQGVNVNQRQPDQFGEGETALMAAAQAGRKEVVELLLGVPGIDLSLKSWDKTALDFAHDPSVVDILKNFETRHRREE